MSCHILRDQRTSIDHHKSAHAKVPSDRRVAATVYTEDDMNAALAEGISDGEDDE